MKPLILLIGSSDLLRRQLHDVGAMLGMHVTTVSEEGGFGAFFDDQRPSLVIFAPARSRTWDSLRVVRFIRRLDGHVPLMLIVEESSEELAIAALRAGVHDYLRAPVSAEQIGSTVERLLIGAVVPHGRVTERTPQGPVIVGSSEVVQRLKASLAKLAGSDVTTLITGETGTGKELAAGAIHANSGRRARQLLLINCAAIPDTLLESELFGYQKGSFTGATRDTQGRLEDADGGTAFFDEIGDMSAVAQAKILRTIEAKEIHRLGVSRTRRTDVRIIAATNRDLERDVESGHFRKDLFFRLNVARVQLPALRDRREDIPSLVEYFIRDFNRRNGGDVESAEPAVLDRLMDYDWPGNVRELRNVVEAMMVSRSRGQLLTGDLPERFQRPGPRGIAASDRERILRELMATKWNRSRTARNLNCSRMTLYRKMLKYHLADEVCDRRPDKKAV